MACSRCDPPLLCEYHRRVLPPDPADPVRVTGPEHSVMGKAVGRSGIALIVAVTFVAADRHPEVVLKFLA